MNSVLFIASQFSQSVREICLFGNGLINDTFLVTTDSSRFVLQRINSHVFSHPEWIMGNLQTLNHHVDGKNSGEVKLQIPGILTSQNNDIAFYDNYGDCWRALEFIEHSASLETIAGQNDAEQTGFALGHFHRLLSDLNPAKLHDTLPGFHITPGYLEHYQSLSNGQSSEKLSPESRFCAEFINAFQDSAYTLEMAKQRGLLPVRVIHGDPKLNNFLFHQQTRQAISLIDLDTVKPGLVHYDIGDCLRSCCHQYETDKFDIEICAHLLKAYLLEAGAFFTEQDYRLLYSAIELIPFELGLRFYTDYLEGNRYFKVAEPEENLSRAVAQFRLCESIRAQKKALKQLIEDCK